MHDAILVGINTILMDDPRLKGLRFSVDFNSDRAEGVNSVQLLPQDDPTLLPPQPLILDPQLRFPLTARLLSEWNTYKSDPGQVVRQPWLICGNGISASRRKKVENAGARVIPVPLDSHGELSSTELELTSRTNIAQRPASDPAGPRP